MANILVELCDGSAGPMELSSNPAKTAAQVLSACARRFHKGEGTLSPKDKPNLALEAEDTVAGGVAYIFIPSAGIQAVRTLDDVTLISEATARAIHRLKREEESEQEETISCTASSTPFVKAEAAARQLGFQVKTVDCELATNAHEQPLEPDYIWEHDEDSVHEKEKVLARLTHELDLSSKTLQATAVFAKPLGVGWPLTVEQIFTTVGTEDFKGSTDRAGWGVPVVLSDLAEATVFQRGNEPKDIFHVQFQSLREAYAHIRWLLDSSKADNPGLRLDTSRAPPAAGMFTIMEHEANLDAGSTSSGARSQTNEYDATDDNTASFVQKERLFKKQLYWLAAKDERVSAFLSTLNQNPQRMPSILDFVPSAQCG